MFFFGATRFSLYSPQSKAWRLSAALSEQEYLNELFSDERMETRYNIFVDRALPIYQAMSENHNYRHILHYSDKLPLKWKDKLQEASLRNSVLFLDETREVPNMASIIKDIMASSTHGDDVFAWFRVDDDDILPTTYLDTLSNYVKREFSGMVVSFGLGLSALYLNGRFKEFRLVRKHLLSQGQAFIGHFDRQTKRIHTPNAGDHSTADMRCPVILDSRTPMYLWTHHAQQDTNVDDVNNAHLKIIKLLDSITISKDIERCGQIFPTVVDDLKRDLNDGELVYTQTFEPNESSIKFYPEILTPGLYTFEIMIKGSEQSKGAIINFETQNKINEFHGLTKSSNEKIDFYKYLKTSEEGALNTFSIYVSQPSVLEHVEIYGWLSQDVEIESIKITKKL